MNAQQRLAHWLATKKRDYREGVQVFIDLNIDIDKVPFFSTKEPGKIHHNILFRHLSNYARVHRVKPKLFIDKPINRGKASGGKRNNQPRTGNQPQKGAAKERVKIDTNPVVKYDELSPELQENFNENGKLTAQNKTFHAELKFISEEPGEETRRKELAELIINNTKIIRSNWERIDGWWNSRKGKTPEQVAAEEAVAKERRIKSNLNYIRRYHNSEKSSQKKAVEKRKKELDTWGVNYEELIKKVSKNT